MHVKHVSPNGLQNGKLEVAFGREFSKTQLVLTPLLKEIAITLVI